MIRGVDVSPLAEQDLDDIWLTIAADSIARADKFVDALTARFVMLSASPNMGRAREELARGLRSVAFRNYVIFYSFRNKSLLIERVIHGARDIKRIFRPG